MKARITQNRESWKRLTQDLNLTKRLNDAEKVKSRMPRKGEEGKREKGRKGKGKHENTKKCDRKKGITCADM